MDLQILDLGSKDGAMATIGGARPLRVNKRGDVQILSQRGIWVNSLLQRDEWVEVDNAVVAAARQKLKIVNDLRNRGLRYQLGSMASVVSRYYTTSEVSPASINMTGRGGSNRDLPEQIEVNVPVPVIFKDFEIPTRALLASRRMGDGLDTLAAEAAAAVVAEALEDMTIGLSTLRLNGQALYGLINHPNRNTATAAGLGGGDFGTIANIMPTVLGMVNMAKADNHYGPYVLYLSGNQYTETLQTYSDGSGQTARQRILDSVPEIKDVVEVPRLTDSNATLVEMNKDTIDFAEPADVIGIQVREWTSDDGLASNFKVMAVFAPRPKADQALRSGIQHITGN